MDIAECKTLRKTRMIAEFHIDGVSRLLFYDLVINDEEKVGLLYKHWIKRMLDILFSLCGILVLLLPMLIVALIVRMDSSGPALFRQKRLGRNGKEYEMYKFRSMYVNSEHTGTGVYSNKNDSRVTRVGRILRATSIDELPQLFNILKGDMSFIGPRPPLTYHPWTIDRYTKEQLRMFDVRPGITGWAQINGRRCVEWNRRIEMNIWYVDHVSIMLDLKIFFATVGKVLANADNENTSETAIRNKPGTDLSGEE